MANCPGAARAARRRPTPRVVVAIPSATAASGILNTGWSGAITDASPAGSPVFIARKSSPRLPDAYEQAEGDNGKPTHIGPRHKKDGREGNQSEAPQTEAAGTT